MLPFIVSAIGKLSNASRAKARATTPPPSQVTPPKTPTNRNAVDLSAILNTPVARNENSTQAFGIGSKLAKPRYNRLAEEAKHSFLGPMPVEEFLDAFLPVQDPVKERNQMPSSRNAFNKVPSSTNDETEIYDPLIKSLNDDGERPSRCPGFQFMNTSTRVEYPNRPGSMKPDICCYAQEYVDIVKIPGTIKANTNMGYAALFFEVKPNPELDFFSDPPPGLTAIERQSWTFVLPSKSNQKNFDRAVEALGQNVAYATEICARQHRCFCFSVSLAGSFARLILWDRAGAVATESFDIRTRPDVLCTFLWRFSQASDQQRGYDLTVQTATQAEEAMFKEAISRKVEEQLGPLLEMGIPNYDIMTERRKVASRKAALENAVLEHYMPDVVTAISMVAQNSDGIDEFHRILISRPVISPLSVASRGTRGYWALDATTHRVVFLKDTWRYDVERMTLEGDILTGLNKLSVRFVPELLYHGNVPQVKISESSEATMMQYTRTHEYLNNEWVCGSGHRVVKHVHYRLIEGTVGYGLQHFSGTKELLGATYDIFQAISDAYTKDKRVHRDVSLGNIILYRELSGIRRGYLVDWELSCRPHSKGIARDYWRTATWQFMSCRVLESRDAQHTLQDDMESLFYVVLYSSLRWLPHDLCSEDLDLTLCALFEHCENFRYGTIGGGGKRLNMNSRRYTATITFTSASLHSWLNTMMNYHHPVGYPEGQLGTFWDPKYLHGFWTEFLRTGTLEDNDRFNHVLLGPSRDCKKGPYEATIPSKSTRKRQVPGAFVEDYDSKSGDGMDTSGVEKASIGRARPLKRARDTENVPSTGTNSVILRRGRSATRGRGRGGIREIIRKR